MIKSMRLCNRCHEEKKDDSFSEKKSSGNGLQPWCKECTVEYNKKWYEANREKHKKYVRDHDRRPRKVHLCKQCDKGEPEVGFHIKQAGNRFYRRFLCFDCEKEYRKKYKRARDPSKESTRKSMSESVSRARLDHRYKHVFRDCLAADKKKKLANDLTKEFIKQLIIKPCMYCEDSNSKMTLDRKDNSLGHLQSNVNPCCARCNYFRRDMPYGAWIKVAPMMKELRLSGLLDGWHCGVGKKKEIPGMAERLCTDLLNRDHVGSTPTAGTMTP